MQPFVNLVILLFSVQQTGSLKGSKESYVLDREERVIQAKLQLWVFYMTAWCRKFTLFNYSSDFFRQSSRMMSTFAFWQRANIQCIHACTHTHTYTNTYTHTHTTQCVSSLGAFGWLLDASVNIRCSCRLSHPSSDAITPHFSPSLSSPLSLPPSLFPTFNSPPPLCTLCYTLPRAFNCSTVCVRKRGRCFKDALLECTCSAL